jgi:hypothetical protein
MSSSMPAKRSLLALAATALAAGALAAGPAGAAHASPLGGTVTVTTILCVVDVGGPIGCDSQTSTVNLPASGSATVNVPFGYAPAGSAVRGFHNLRIQQTASGVTAQVTPLQLLPAGGILPIASVTGPQVAAVPGSTVTLVPKQTAADPNPAGAPEINRDRVSEQTTVKWVV